MPKTKFSKAFFSELTKNLKSILLNSSEEDLVELIQQLNYYYYNKGTSKVSDDTYDVIRNELIKRNKNHPLLNHVGAVVKNENARKETLPVYMGSMDKLKDVNENTLENFKKKQSTDSYIISDKLDGVSALLYIDESNTKLYSRGNGKIGQNISHLIPFIKSLSNFIKYRQNIIVRGELIINKTNFEKVKDKGANARNMVAGLVNAKKPDLSILKLVEFCAYELIADKTKPQDQLEKLIREGFNVVHYQKVNTTGVTIENLSNILVTRRAQSSYEIDGIIVASNTHYSQISDKNPTHAFAFKSILTQEVAEVVVTNVEWNISKDGYFIPVVEIEPVQLSGVWIRRATGFNGEFIEKNKIGVGSRVLVIRSGDVIPYIQKVLKTSDSGVGQMPTEPYEWTATGKDIKAINNSEALNQKHLENFFNVIDIKGVSNKSVEKLYNNGFKTIESVLKAKSTDFEKIDGLLNKSVFYEKLHMRLKEIDCITLMQASNAFGRGFGTRKLEPIIKQLPKIVTDVTYKPSIDDLIKIDGVSIITANAFLKGLEEFRKFSKVIESVIKCTSSMPLNNNKSKKTLLLNEVIVFTGFRDKQLEELVILNGGKIATSVSGKTTIIVAKDPDADSQKLKDAKKKGIKIIGKEEFEANLKKT